MRAWALDIISVVGAALVVSGVAMWSIPAGVVTCGGFALAVGILGAKRWA